MVNFIYYKNSFQYKQFFNHPVPLQHNDLQYFYFFLNLFMQSFLFVFFFHFLFFLYFLLSCNCKNAVVREDSERPHVPFIITSYRTLYCSQFNITRKNDAGSIHRGHSVIATFTCSCMCVHACTHACVCVCVCV